MFPFSVTLDNHQSYQKKTVLIKTKDTTQHSLFPLAALNCHCCSSCCGAMVLRQCRPPPSETTPGSFFFLSSIIRYPSFVLPSFGLSPQTAVGPPPWIPHSAGLAEVPRHVPDGHHPPTILTANPPTHTSTDIHSHPSPAVRILRFPVAHRTLKTPAARPHRPPPRHLPLPRRPLLLLPFPLPCKTARDGRSSRKTLPPYLHAYLHLPHSLRPSSNLPPARHVLQFDDRRVHPSSLPPGHSPRTQTSLSLPLSDASYSHASPNQLSAYTTSRSPHAYTSNPHSLSSRSSQASLTVPPHVPILKLSFIHIQMIHSLFHQLFPSAPITRQPLIIRPIYPRFTHATPPLRTSADYIIKEGLSRK